MVTADLDNFISCGSLPMCDASMMVSLAGVKLLVLSVIEIPEVAASNAPHHSTVTNHQYFVILQSQFSIQANLSSVLG